MVLSLQSVQGADLNWKTNLDSILNKGFENLATSTVKEMAFDPAAVQKAAAVVPDWKTLIKQIQTRNFSQPEKRGELSLYTMTGSDGKERPWVLYVPESYWHKRATPAIVALHGGVSRVSLAEDPIEWASNSPWLDLAKTNGWFAIFPFGQEGATWWDETGMENIRRQLHLVKENFNIDDDRVYMAGFSDGASAGFLHAMLRPDNFGAIIALNGHMGVGSLDGDLPTYAPNMANTPIYTVTTDNDGLYPTKVMGKTIEMAIKAGADIFYRQLPGTHSFDYAKTELPIIAKFIEKNPRNTVPEKLFWEVGETEFGRCRWIEILEVLPAEKASWHQDHNCILISDRVSVGFMPRKSDHGVKVGRVLEKTYAAQIGLKNDDIIVKAGGLKVANNDDLEIAKASVKRGDLFDICVERASETIELKGRLPAPELYNLFKRDVPSAAVKVSQIGNCIEIEGSRVGQLRVFINKDQFNLNEKLVIKYNGAEVFNEMVAPDKEFILENYLQNRDRKMLPVAKVDLKLK
jgi:predicted esterase